MRRAFLAALRQNTVRFWSRLAALTQAITESPPHAAAFGGGQGGRYRRLVAGMEFEFRVLAVDAEDKTCVPLNNLLGDRRFDVICVPTPVAAYRPLDHEASTLDALIVDIDVGGGTMGFEVARQP